MLLVLLVLMFILTATSTPGDSGDHPDLEFLTYTETTPASEAYNECYDSSEVERDENIINMSDLTTNVTQAKSILDELYDKYFDIEYYNQRLYKLRQLMHSLKDAEEYWSLQNMFTALERKIFIWTVVRKYVSTTLYSLIVLVGLVGNVLLVIMFALHKEIRTAPNLVIFNIAVSDILSLIFVVPVYCLSEYLGAAVFPGVSACYHYVFFRISIMSATEISIILLSSQRLLATEAFKEIGSLRFLLSTSVRTVGLCIFGIWTFSLMISIPLYTSFYFSDGTCFPFMLNYTSKKVSLMFFIVFFATLPLPVIYLSILTVWRLRDSRIPVRSRAAIVTLCIFYTTVFIPRPIWHGYISWMHINHQDPEYIIIHEAINILNFLDACLNPAALYLASNTYRALFRRYLLLSFLKTDESKSTETEL